MHIMALMRISSIAKMANAGCLDIRESTHKKMAYNQRPRNLKANSDVTCRVTVSGRMLLPSLACLSPLVGFYVYPPLCSLCASPHVSLCPPVCCPYVLVCALGPDGICLCGGLCGGLHSECMKYISFSCGNSFNCLQPPCLCDPSPFSAWKLELPNSNQEDQLALLSLFWALGRIILHHDK